MNHMTTLCPTYISDVEARLINKHKISQPINKWFQALRYNKASLMVSFVYIKDIRKIMPLCKWTVRSFVKKKKVILLSLKPKQTDSIPATTIIVRTSPIFLSCFTLCLYDLNGFRAGSSAKSCNNWMPQANERNYKNETC